MKHKTASLPALRVFSGLVCVCSLHFFSGCAGSSVLHDYSYRVDPVLQSVSAGNPERALQQLRGYRGKNLDGPDRQLFLAESARTSFITGKTENSREFFCRLIAEEEQREEEAVLRGRDVLAQSMALAINDNAIPYSLPPYEQVFVRHYQALNYLFEGNLEAAAVEMRRAVYLQEKSRQRYRDYENAIQQEEQKRGITDLTRQMEGNLQRAYGQTTRGSGTITSSFDNPATWYLAGLIFEAGKDPDNARIAYSKALEMVPDSPPLQQTVERLTHPTPAHKSPPRVVHIHENGFVTRRAALYIPFPAGKQTLSVAFPYYPSTHAGFTDIALLSGGRPVAHSHLLCNVNLLAQMELREEMPMMVLRSVLRNIAKYSLADSAHDSMGDTGFFWMQLINLLTERADLRSWYTLPSSIQLAVATIPPGPHSLTIPSLNVSLEEKLFPDDTLLIHTIQTGPNVHVQTAILSGNHMRNTTETVAPLPAKEQDSDDENRQPKEIP